MKEQLHGSCGLFNSNWISRYGEQRAVYITDTHIHFPNCLSYTKTCKYIHTQYTYCTHTYIQPLPFKGLGSV